MSMSLRGDSEIMYREISHQLPAPNGTISPGISLKTWASAGHLITLMSPSRNIRSNLSHYSYDYTRKEYSDWSNRRIQPPMMPVVFPSADDR